MARSPARFLTCLDRRAEILKELRRLSEYALARQLEGTRDPHTRAITDELTRLTQYTNAATGFVEAEIMALEETVISDYLEAEPGLQSYEFYLHDLNRRRTRTFSRPEERLISEAQLMAAAPRSIYLTLIDELRYPAVELSTGEMFPLDPEGFGRRRAALPSSEDRDLVTERYSEVSQGYARVLGALLNARMNADLFQTRARHYDDALEMILAPDSVPVAVYHSLIAAARANLDSFHRYLKLRQRLLGVDALRYADLSTSTATGVDRDYPPETARRLILEALRPMGEEYVSIAERAFADRWVEWYSQRPNGLGLRGAYAEHPYILLNYRGTYESVSTLAHELGHALHRYIADRAQPFPNTFFHTSFVEVPALFHELLLKRRALDGAEDDDARLFLLFATLESSLFDRARWAEFELRIHQEVEKGNSLTGEVISEIYLELLREYYGHDEGVCTVAAEFGMEWMRDRLIFLRSYGIYRYAVAHTIAMVFGERVLDGDRQAVEDYLAYLAAGGSDYPINLLEKAGVDVTSPGPFQSTMASMDRAMDEIESILDRAGR